MQGRSAATRARIVESVVHRTVATRVRHVDTSALAGELTAMVVGYRTGGSERPQSRRSSNRSVEK